MRISRFVAKKSRRNRHFTPTEKDDGETTDRVTRGQGYYST